ncbi:hypothetical protein WICPIJ_004750 [Wickerhamomyces pijperi]|uniref:DNA mitochondrial polymerase exonuclease domain-containing protein n=1 Tax=Wickerhamomyces pijperi TaxID=599730 RepID=A0A9P8TML3_WICPI|nr:hypothetical protein WICPIJ_004750 [Wickerhamomyces pijperi]
MIRSVPKPNARMTKKAAEEFVSSLGKISEIAKPYSVRQPEAFSLDAITKEKATYFIRSLGLKQSAPYLKITDDLLKRSKNPDVLTVPPKPKEWLQKAGWYRYTFHSPPEKVDYPLEDLIVFDVERLYEVSQYPTLATACSTEAWYGWVSKYIADPESTDPEDMIPLNPHNERKVVVGHNVSYDRAMVADGYDLQKMSSNTFYLDTMGVYTQGFPFYKIVGITEKNVFEPFMEPYFKDNEAKNLHRREVKRGLTLKSLAERYTDVVMDKEARNEFKARDKKRVVEKFNILMNYCADDVVATLKLFLYLYPKFNQKITSPSQIVGLRDMGNSKVVVDSLKWKNITFNNNKLEKEATESAKETIKAISESKGMPMKRVPSLTSTTVKNLMDVSFFPAYKPNDSKVDFHEIFNHSRTVLTKGIYSLWFNRTFRPTTPESEKFIKQTLTSHFWSSTKKRITAPPVIPIPMEQECSVILPMVKTLNGVDLKPNEPFWLSVPPPVEFKQIGQPVDQYTRVPSNFSNVSIDLNLAYTQSVAEFQELTTVSPYLIRQNVNHLQAEYLYDLLLCTNELFSHFGIDNYHLLTTYSRSLSFLVPTDQQELAQLALEISQYWVELSIMAQTRKRSTRLTEKYVNDLEERTQILTKGLPMLSYSFVETDWKSFKYSQCLKLKYLQEFLDKGRRRSSSS